MRDVHLIKTPPLFTLSWGRGRRRCTHRQSVRGLPRTHPRTTTIPQGRSPPHTLLRERQTPVYPPAIGEGSSGHPSPGYVKHSLLGDLCLTRGTGVGVNLLKGTRRFTLSKGRGECWRLRQQKVRGLPGTQRWVTQSLLRGARPAPPSPAETGEQPWALKLDQRSRRSSPSPGGEADSGVPAGNR